MNNVNSRRGISSIKYIPNVNSGVYNSLRDGSSLNPSICL